MMPIGNGTVAIGMSERTTGQMIEKIALALFAARAGRPGDRRGHDRATARTCTSTRCSPSSTATA